MDTTRTDTRDESRTLESAAPSSTPTHGREWLRERVDGRVALGVAGAWLVLSQVAALLEPATAHEVPVVGVVLNVVVWTLLATMAAGLLMQRRWGFASSLAAAVVFTAASIACPTTGHHSFGTWWFGQMACALALVAVSVLAVRSRSVSGDGELA